MALLGTHTVKGTPVHVYASTNDIGYIFVDNTIVTALDRTSSSYCAGLLCSTPCPFFTVIAPSCAEITTNFLHEHYSSQYPEYFI